MSRQAACDWAITIMLIFVVTCGLVVACAKGMEDEDKARDQQRLDRCAKFGETLPAAVREYCKGQ